MPQIPGQPPRPPQRPAPGGKKTPPGTPSQEGEFIKKDSPDIEQKPMQPPLTPMIDVTFQLLIFFLLTAQFRASEGQIPGSLPKRGGVSSAAADPKKPIKIRIQPIGDERQDCAYTVDGSPPITTAKLLYGTLLRRKQAFGADGETVPVVVKPQGDVRWMHVVNAFNQAVRVKFDSIGFATPG